VAVLLIFAIPVLIFLSFRENVARNNYPVLDAVIQSVICFSLLVVFSTEILSALNLFNYMGILFFWIICFSVLVINLLRSPLTDVKALFRSLKNQLLSIDKISRIIIISFIVVLFLQGLIYPPNNFDSMTYHLSRMVHWIKNENVHAFATHIPRQVFMPPFAEWLTAQICILSKSDFFANSVQQFYFVSTLPVLVRIGDLLTFSIKQKRYLVLFAITLPQVILQSTSTQNNLVLSFFVAASIYYAFHAFRNFTWKFVFLYGFSTGLAFLTKGTALVFIAPVFFIPVPIIILQKTDEQLLKKIIKISVAFILVISVGAGYYYRNLLIAGNPYGVSVTDRKVGVNQEISPPVFLSNLTRNVGLHFAVPVINEAAENIISCFHQAINQDINSPLTTFGFVGKFYISYYATHEDFAPNIVHAVLIMFALAFLLIKWKTLNRIFLLYSLIFLIQIFCFTILFKWQPWHSRLHTPGFILAAPIVAWTLSQVNRKVILTSILAVLLGYACLVVVFNYSRPLISIPGYTSPFGINSPRFSKYFATKPELLDDFVKIKSRLKNCKNIEVGMIIGIDDWEYPLFTDIYEKGIYPEHILVGNVTARYQKPGPGPPYIITTCPGSSRIYHGREYQSILPKNNKYFLLQRVGDREKISTTEVSN